MHSKAQPDLASTHPSERVSVNQLPRLALISIGLVLFHTYVLFMAYVAEPYGLIRFMPFYDRLGPCPWDLVVAALITLFVARAGRRRAARDQSTAPQRS
jgi:hypothetical protein